MTIFNNVNQILSKQNKSILSTAEIKALCFQHYGLNKSSVIPSDYCYNRTNHGIGKGKNILIFLSQGQYKYVGINHKFNGWVYHKEKGATKDKIVGEWKDGLYIEFEQPITHQKTNNSSNQKVSGLTKDKLEKLYADYLQLLNIELSVLGCQPTETRHLIGRIGEFKCAIETNGALASTPNQHGFDVVSSNGKRISVKTTAQKTGFVSINANTTKNVDELMVIQYQANQFTTIFHGDIKDAIEVSRRYKNNYELEISKAKTLQ